jgi:hypothetical protein
MPPPTRRGPLGCPKWLVSLLCSQELYVNWNNLTQFSNRNKQVLWNTQCEGDTFTLALHLLDIQTLEWQCEPGTDSWPAIYRKKERKAETDSWSWNSEHILWCKILRCLCHNSDKSLAIDACPFLLSGFRKSGVAHYSCVTMSFVGDFVLLAPQYP